MTKEEANRVAYEKAVWFDDAYARTGQEHYQAKRDAWLEAQQLILSIKEDKND